MKLLGAEVALPDRDVELLEREERPRARLVLFPDVEVVEADGALHRELWRVVRRAREPDVQRQRQPSRLDGEREPHRDEGQVARQIERLEPKLEHGLQRLREGLRAAVRDERRPVDAHAQPGLDEGVKVYGQRRYERHANRQRGDLVVVARGTIVEDHGAVTDPDVIEREARRRGVGRRRRLGALGPRREPRQDVREVVSGVDIRKGVQRGLRAYDVDTR